MPCKSATAYSCRPVIVVSVTNHALDHILRRAVETGVTEKLLRLGAGTKDEVIANYTVRSKAKLSPFTAKKLAQIHSKMRYLCEVGLRLFASQC